MAPAQVVEVKDLPPEILDGGLAPAAGSAGLPVAGPLPTGAGQPPTALPEAPLSAGDTYTPPTAPAHLPVPPWLAELRRDARRRLEAHEPEVWEQLSQQFEASLIQTALEITRGRRIEAAQRLGIGRNTITRKIQELKLPD
jgi:two-component system nitrogen regulation response regulator GlnG